MVTQIITNSYSCEKIQVYLNRTQFVIIFLLHIRRKSYVKKPTINLLKQEKCEQLIPSPPAFNLSEHNMKVGGRCTRFRKGTLLSYFG